MVEALRLLLFTRILNRPRYGVCASRTAPYYQLNTCVAGLLHNLDISMGFAFGRFAIFSMARCRTKSISVLDMTYLFLVIVVSVISSVGPVSLPELVVLSTIICALTWICETRLLATRHEVLTLTCGCMKNLKHRKSVAC